MADYFCEKCGSPIKDSDKFCEECGAPAAPRFETFEKPGEPGKPDLICPHCGASRDEGDLFCQECGARVDDIPPVESEYIPEHAEPPELQPESMERFSEAASLSAPPGEEEGAPTDASEDPDAAPRGLSCPSCGASYDEGDLFCQECGARVDIPPVGSEYIPEPAEPSELQPEEMDRFTEPALLPAPPGEDEGVAGDVPAAEDLAPVGLMCENCGAPIADGDLFCQSCGVDVSRSLASPACGEDSPARDIFLAGHEDLQGGLDEVPPGEAEDEPSVGTEGARRGAGKRFKLFRRIACVFALLILIAGLASGGYYYFFCYGERGGGGEGESAHPGQGADAGVSAGSAREPDAILSAAEERSLRERGLRWSPADAGGYSFLVPSDPMRVFSEPPSLSARAAEGGANLRAEPSLSSSVTGQLSKGESVDITQRYSSAKDGPPWYRARVSGRDGWLPGGDIEFK